MSGSTVQRNRKNPVPHRESSCQRSCPLITSAASQTLPSMRPKIKKIITYIPFMFITPTFQSGKGMSSLFTILTWPCQCKQLSKKHKVCIPEACDLSIILTLGSGILHAYLTECSSFGAKYKKVSLYLRAECARTSASGTQLWATCCTQRHTG